MLNCEVVALCGKAGSGKDEVAKRLVERHGFHEVRIAEVLWRILEDAYLRESLYHRRADELLEYPPEGKDIARATFKDELFHGRYCGYTGRQVLIAIGNAIRDAIGSEAWMRGIVSKAVEQGHDRLVIPDLRLDSEAVALSSLCDSVAIVLVKRPEGDWGADEESRRDSTETEHESLTPDIIIANDGSLEELKQSADELSFVNVGIHSRRANRARSIAPRGAFRG